MPHCPTYMAGRQNHAPQDPSWSISSKCSMFSPLFCFTVGSRREQCSGQEHKRSLHAEHKKSFHRNISKFGTQINNIPSNEQDRKHHQQYSTIYQSLLSKPTNEDDFHKTLRMAVSTWEFLILSVLTYLYLIHLMHH